ncbi:unnamed protein product [Blepharisma stoltei]|uniref:Uncharacterized protein n=1 Tax=Blepharisma stoltei TaxID=1481888 RepID=A0AAU9K8A4_9CILI|nr:unnamed protein product [Blepharisma stoltei]
MGEEFANGINARFFETSAKDDINVNEVFKHMLCEIKKFVDWIGDNAGIIIKQSKVKGTKNFMHLIDKRQ